MIVDSTIIKQCLSSLYAYASEKFKHDMLEARKEFDLLVPIPPVDDTEMQGRLIMFSHWFLMDRIVGEEKTPADIFFQDHLLDLSYQEEALYRALRISKIGIYSVTQRHGDHFAIDVATGERFKFQMDMGINVHSSGEIMTMRFITMEQKTFLLASYATHHYSTKAFIHDQLSMLNMFDRIAFSKKVFELTALSLKSRKYTWVEPLSIYKGMTRL